jgi:hypothetical protein
MKIKTSKYISILSASAILALIGTTAVYAADGDVYKVSDKSVVSLHATYNGNLTEIAKLNLMTAANPDKFGYEKDDMVYGLDSVFEKFQASFEAGEVNPASTMTVGATSVGDASEFKASLTVKSVSAITTTGVEVTFAATTEAKTDITVEVKNGSGVVVAVVATDIAKGATFAQFDFATPVVTANLTGVWTVDGNDYSFTAIKQLADIKVLAAAGTLDQVALSNGLTAAGIINVEDSLIATYASDITAAAVKTETLAELQLVIDKTNTTNETAVVDAAAVKTVVEAKTQMELYSALTAGFDRVNSAWSLDYASGTATAPGIEFNAGTPNTNVIYIDAANNNGTTKADIQTAIDAVNAAKILAADGSADTSVKQAAATASIQAWVIADDSTTPLVTPKATAIKASQVKEDVLKVAEATTANTVYSALVNLANFDATTLKIADLDSKLVAEYFVAQQANAATIISTKTITSVIANVITPAETAAADTLLAAAKAPVASGTVGVVADEAAVKKALTDFGVKNVLSTGYLTTAAQAAIAAGAVTNLATLQTAVDAQSLIEVKAVIAAGTAGTVADEAKAAGYLTAFGVKNVSSTGYLTSAAQSAIAAGAVNSLSTLQTVVDAATVVLNQNVQVKAINDATTVAEVKSALDKLAIGSYVNVPSTDKLFIAEKVLEVRDTLAAGRDAVKADGTASGNVTTLAVIFVDSDEVTGTVFNVAASYDTLIANLNAATLTSTSTAVANLSALGYDAFDALDAGAKANVAEAFVTNYQMNADNTSTVDYKSLTAIDAAIDAAITAVK